MEGEARLIVRSGRDHSDRRKPIGADEKAIVQALRGKMIGEQCAEAIAGDVSKERTGHAEARQANGEVEGGAAGDSTRRQAGTFPCADKQINQCFAADEDHGFPA